MKPNANIIFIVLSAVIVAIGAYVYFRPGADTEEPVMNGVVQTPEQIEFQTLVAELEPIKFNTSIFQDPEFKALQDLTTPIAPEQAGRADPFAPVSGVSGQ